MDKTQQNQVEGSNSSPLCQGRKVVSRFDRWAMYDFDKMRQVLLQIQSDTEKRLAEFVSIHPKWRGEVMGPRSDLSVTLFVGVNASEVKSAARGRPFDKGSIGPHRLSADLMEVPMNFFDASFEAASSLGMKVESAGCSGSYQWGVTFKPHLSRFKK